MAASASATVTRYQASLHSPHNALHSPSYRRTSDRSNFALRRSARRLTAHAHRCVKLKQGRVSDKARRAPSLCVLDGIVLSIEGLQDYWDTTG